MISKDEIVDTINLCKKGNSKAQKLVYESYYDRYFTLCLRYVGDPMVASEMVNFSFYKIFTKIKQLNDPKMFEGWMKRICINVCLNEIKQNKKMQFVEMSDNEVNAYDIETEESNLHLEDLLKMVSKLPPQMRSVFNMFVIDGYSHKEISETLNISVGVCKFHLHEAKAKLKTMINTENNILLDYRNGRVI